MTLRKTTSLTSLLSFILLLITSIFVYINPQGKIANWANWEVLGLDKGQWEALHTNLGILFIVACLIHTILNWDCIMAYLKNKAQKTRVFTTDFNIALFITFAVTLTTLLNLPPINAIQTFKKSLKEAAAEKYGNPPYGHAEDSTLEAFCKRTGASLKPAIKKLEKAQLKSIDADATLSEIAEANRIAPQQVYDIIKPAPTQDVKKGMPTKPRMGFSRKTLAGTCANYGLDAPSIINGLKGLGLDATPEMSIKEIAEKNDTTPRTIFEAIHQLQAK